MAQPLVVLHGGCWNNNSYRGGTKDYIPIPPGGLRYETLLSKIESRLNKDLRTHTFDIDAIVKAHQGETFRMKVTDDFEWTTLMEMTHFLTLYVKACPKSRVGTQGIYKECTDVDAYDVGSIDISCGRASINGMKQRTMVGMNKQAMMGHADVNLVRDPPPNGTIGIGAVFRCKDNMISAIHSYHFKNSLEFQTTRSNFSWYYLVCKYEFRCTFSMRCKAVGKSWKITQLSAHTCAKDMRNCSEPSVSARAIAEYLVPNMDEDGFSVRPCDIRGQVLREYGVRLSYNTSLNGRNRALKLMYGDQDESF